MKPSLVFMIRLSGSVKLRCALSSGTPLGGWPLRPRLAATSLSSPAPWPAAACASASSAALASRILASRRSLLATQSGSSSPRRSPPCWRSSAASASGALFLGPSHPAVAHRLVLGGIRLNLGAVERDMAELDQTRFAAQPEDLYKQTPDSAPRCRLGNSMFVPKCCE